jgi:hypothetical protein
MAEETQVGQCAHREKAVIGLTKSSDRSLNNPDTLTKYKSAAQISQKVLETVSGASNDIVEEKATDRYFNRTPSEWA